MVLDASKHNRLTCSAGMQKGCVPAAGAVPPDMPDRDFSMITDSFNKLMEELAQGLSLHQQSCQEI